MSGSGVTTGTVLIQAVLRQIPMDRHRPLTAFIAVAAGATTPVTAEQRIAAAIRLATRAAFWVFVFVWLRVCSNRHQLAGVGAAKPPE